MVDLSQEELSSLLGAWKNVIVNIPEEIPDYYDYVWDGEDEQAYDQLRKLIQRKVSREELKRWVKILFESELYSKEDYIVFFANRLKELNIKVEDA